MSIENQVQKLMEASNPLWIKVMEEAILVNVPEAEKERVLNILIASRVNDLSMALRFSKKTGSPKQASKFIQELEQRSNNVVQALYNAIQPQ